MEIDQPRAQKRHSMTDTFVSKHLPHGDHPFSSPFRIGSFNNPFQMAEMAFSFIAYKLGVIPTTYIHTLDDAPVVALHTLDLYTPGGQDAIVTIPRGLKDADIDWNCDPWPLHLGPGKMIIRQERREKNNSTGVQKSDVFVCFGLGMFLCVFVVFFCFLCFCSWLVILY